MSTGWALIVSLILLAGNAFFVAAEFAVVAAKRHRMQQGADRGSRAARAAVAASRELSLMLAGAQLGITLCTLGLGALAKPAVADLLEPLFTTLGIPAQAAVAVAFILALSLVVFLHMIIGEMAPKSWAITHPETAALALALPFRGIIHLTRPALAVLNGLANTALRAIKVTPQNELAHVHGPEELRLLIKASRQHGTLPEPEHDLLTAMLRVRSTPISTVMIPASSMATVDTTATAAHIEQTSRDTGRSRLIVVDPGRDVAGIVHVRDAVRATTTGHDSVTAYELMTAAQRLPARMPITEAVQAMRAHRTQLAIADDHGHTLGLIALEDLLEQVIGEFDDETDPVPAAAGRHQ